MTSIITSVRNPRILELARLRRGGRVADAPVLIDGRREIDRAARAGWTLEELFVCPGLLDEADRAWAARSDLPVRQRIEVSQPVLERIAFGDRADGLVATARRPARELASLTLSATPLIAVVQGLEKPGNLGAILRSAAAAGVEAVIVSDARTDVYHSSVIRASTGAVFSVPIVETDGEAARQWLAQRRISIIAARPDGADEYTCVNYRGATAFVLGAEAEGLAEDWRNAAIQPVRIPMQGAVDSLNVSVTAALLFYEARRQRTAGH